MTGVAQGETYTWSATIRDGNGFLADCADLALTIADPDGDVLAGFPVTAPAIIHDALGEYHYVWSVGAGEQLGVYDADWSGTVDGLAVGGSDSVEVMVAGTVSPVGPTYATLDDLQKSMKRVEDDALILAAMSQALVFGTDRITEELEVDFFRHPETWLVHGSGTTLLHVHSGIVSLSAVRIRPSRLNDWVSLTETDYDLESRSASDPNQVTAAVFPFDHIRLNGTGTYGFWPRGRALVEFTGVRGWPSIPSRAIEANVAMSRQIMAADRTFPGGVISPDEFGAPVLPSRLPDAVYRLKAWHSNLFASCGV